MNTFLPYFNKAILNFKILTFNLSFISIEEICANEQLLTEYLHVRTLQQRAELRILVAFNVRRTSAQSHSSRLTSVYDGMIFHVIPEEYRVLQCSTVQCSAVQWTVSITSFLCAASELCGGREGHRNHT